jgi:hypothetical protein
MLAVAAPEDSGATTLNAKMEIGITTNAAAIIDAHVRGRPERVGDRVREEKYNY